MDKTIDQDEENQRLDKEIATLKKQASQLQRHLKVETSVILASSSARSALRTSSPSVKRKSKKLAEHAAKLEAHTQQCVYRLASSITTFKVKDPDPNAVDGGHVLGLRFEVMSQGKFLNPYYVMLNRPFGEGRKELRVHRHTVPPAIPLGGLAARYLPEPKKQIGGDPEQEEEEEEEEKRGQNLDRFARCLRREIVRYHNRLGASADLRRSLSLLDTARESPSDNAIISVGLADIEAKQIDLTWADGRTGRLVMDDDGKVQKLAVLGNQGRDWTTAGLLFQEDDRIEDVVEKLGNYTNG